MKQKGFLLAAGVSLAMVFTFSCSGDDGERGEQGEGCSVVENADGATITCGEQVVRISNGTDGANGTNGTNGINGSNGAAGKDCSVEKLDDTGFVITCGGNKVGIAFCGDDNILYNPLEQLCYGDSLVRDFFTDSRDNTKYTYVKIGDYLWMAENLTYGADDGKYTWAEAQTACPAGWKLPTKDEVEDNETEIQDILSDGANDIWWTATAHATNENRAYYYGYDSSGDFDINYADKVNNSYFVRCVKAN